MKIIIDKFVPKPGLHCISNSMRQIFEFNSVNLSEEILFGLGSGLNFFYFDFKFAPVPMIGGRTKLGELESNIAKSLNLDLNILETSSQAKGYSNLLNELKSGQPAMILVDMAYLDYLNMPEEYHFGGHSIVVFGIDEETGIVYVSDRDGKDFKVTLNPNEIPRDYHELSLERLNIARNSKFKPYPPKNALFKFDFESYHIPTKPRFIEALRKNADSIMNPPIKNLGLSGINKFAMELPKWANFESEKLKRAGLEAFIFINKVGGSGGGCFRRMFGNFLIELNDNFEIPDFLDLGKEYLEVSEIWDKVGDMFYQIFINSEFGLLPEIQKDLKSIYNLECNIWDGISKKL